MVRYRTPNATKISMAVTEMNRVLKNEMLSSKHFPERLHNRSKECSLVIYGGSDLVCTCVDTAHSSCM